MNFSWSAGQEGKETGVEGHIENACLCTGG